MLDNVFLIQLIGIISAGGFIGEFQRAINAAPSTSFLPFMANFFAGSFLSFLITYLFYIITEMKDVTLILGGLLSFQEAQFISKLSKKVITQLLDREEGQ